MSSSVQTKLLTAEEFFLLPNPGDGSQLELVRGEVVTMSPAGGLHGICCAIVARRIGNYVEDHNLGVVACNDTGVVTERRPDSVRGPDVAYWSKDRLPEIPVGFIEAAPNLVVEVLSPSNTLKHIREKRREYFAKGVNMVWVIAPEDRMLTTYRTVDEGRALHESATVTGEDVLPGFSCLVSDLLP